MRAATVHASQLSMLLTIAMAVWLYRNLHEKVDQLVISKPRCNKLISCEGDRDDKVDSGKLAALLRGNFLKMVHHACDNGILLNVQSIFCKIAINQRQDVKPPAVQTENVSYIEKSTT